MRKIWYAAFGLMLPVLGFGANKEMVQLQRDVSILQDDVRTLQRTLEDKLGQLQILVQQSSENANKTNASVGQLQQGLNDRLGKQQQDIGASVAALGSKVDQMTTEFATLRESMADLTARMGKMQQQILDLKNISSLTPAAALPPPPGSVSAPQNPNAPPPGMSAEATFNNGLRDYQARNYDLAQQEFSDYLKYYGTTDLASNAQFYLGMIAFNKGDNASATKAFDAVIEKYPDGPKTADARLMKGKVLVRDGQRTAAGKEFREILRLYPNKDQAAAANAELRALGLTPATPAPATTRRRSR